MKKGNFFILIAILLLSYLGISLLMYSLFYTNELLEISFSGLVPRSRMGEIYEMIHKYKWLNISITSIIPFVSIVYTTFCLYVSFFLSDVKIKIRTLGKAVIESQFIFLFVFLFKILWHYFKGINSLFELNQMPFSLASFFDIPQGDIGNAWLQFSLSALNIFELIYVFSLPLFITNKTSFRYKELLKPTLWGYLTGLFLYIILVSLLSLSL